MPIHNPALGTKTYVDFTTAIVLNNLVRSAIRAATNDVRSTIALDRDGVLADVLEPDKLERAGAQAVNALHLVGADDDVLERGALLQDKDGIGLAALGVVQAGARAAVVLNPLGVERLASRDVLRLAERLAAGCDGEAALVATTGQHRWHGGGERENACVRRHSTGQLVFFRRRVMELMAEGSEIE